jgi:hypothetical protein
VDFQNFIVHNIASFSILSKVFLGSFLFVFLKENCGLYASLFLLPYAYIRTMYVHVYSMADFGIVKEVKTFWFFGGQFVYPLIRIHEDMCVSIMQYVHILACSTPLLSMLYYHNRILVE